MRLWEPQNKTNICIGKKNNTNIFLFFSAFSRYKSIVKKIKATNLSFSPFLDVFICLLYKIWEVRAINLNTLLSRDHVRCSRWNNHEFWIESRRMALERKWIRTRLHYLSRFSRRRHQRRRPPWFILAPPLVNIQNLAR